MTSIASDNHASEHQPQNPNQQGPAATDVDRIESLPPLNATLETQRSIPQDCHTPKGSTESSAENGQASSNASNSAFSSGYQIAPRGDYFRSRRIKKGEVERPWLDKKDPREKWVTAFPIIGFVSD
jgi:hypothetical protein